MINFKTEISKKISKVIDIDDKEINSYLEIPKDETMGEYALPCFRLAKELRKSPQNIAEEIKEKLEIDNDSFIEKIENVGGYLNFYIKQDILVKNILEKVDTQKEKYGSSTIGNGKNIVIDYSSPNIAKPFHVGHLRTTVIGAALYNIYKYLGYNVIGINHLGDWGTQFGKIIEGYKRWKDEYDIESDPINELTKIYVRINAACKEDETILEECRNTFKKLENGDEYCQQIWEKFRDLSLKEFQKVYDLLGSKFDSWNGEAFYKDKCKEVIDKLEEKGVLKESDGARIVDLQEKGINTPCIIEKTNGSTTYATRDIAAILYRARTYNFDKAIYVTSYEQTLHFKQIFEVAKLLGLDEKYTNNLIHVPFGMVHLKSGKISTRDGNIIKLEDLLNESIQRAKVIIEEKNPNLENKEDVAKKVGVGAVIFNDLSNSRIKDEIFDWDIILNFQGETGPYVQYTYVRTNSILSSIDKIPTYNEIKVEKLLDKHSIKVLKTINQFNDVLINATEKNEPSFVARYLIELAQNFSSFYNENKIIVEDNDTKNARVYLTKIVGQVLKQGAELLGIEMPERM